MIHVSLFARILLLYSLVLYAGCGEPECYECTGHLGTLPQTVSNVCGPQLLEYLQKMGWSCRVEAPDNPVAAH